MEIWPPVIFFKASHFDLYASFSDELAVILLVVGAAFWCAGHLQ
jgi:hypothetical protein